MEVTCSSETSVDFQGTTQCYIPEDGTLRNHCCENLKSYIYFCYCQRMMTVHWWKDVKLVAVEVCNGRKQAQHVQLQF
jgi:hypothetical protein